MTERGQPKIEGIRQFQARGRCTYCYQRALESGELISTRNNEYTDTEIRCKKCNKWKPYSAYKNNPQTVTGKMYTCRFCDKLWERYRITSEQYLDLLEAQDYKCVICLKNLESFTLDVNIDHDHACCPSKTRACGNCVRGLLCRPCNIGLGAFKDKESNLLRAIGYLRSGGIHV